MKLKPNLGTAFLIFSVSLLAIDDKKIPNDADRPPGAAIIDKIRDTVTISRTRNRSWHSLKLRKH